MDLDQIRQNARQNATANIFAAMSSEEKSQQLLAQIRGQSDAMIDLDALYQGIPADQLEIYRAMVRGQDNPFYDELSQVNNLLKTGDLILSTGNTTGARIITKGQKFGYKNARSSHVALIHADFVCVDAVPGLGVSNRLVSDVLSDVKPDWRVIRCKKLGSEHLDSIYQACAFYLAQPYKILPSKKPMKGAAYCSELARKVFLHTGVTGIGIPNDCVLSPGKYDDLADNHLQWEDVTEHVRPAIDFSFKYQKLISVVSRLMIEGLKLNRKRFEDRKAQIQVIQLAAKDGTIPMEKAKEFIKSIREIETNMNHQFWDHTK